jgi:chaperonin GroES
MRFLDKPQTVIKIPTEKSGLAQINLADERKRPVPGVISWLKKFKKNGPSPYVVTTMTLIRHSQEVMQMKIKPMNDRILVLRVESEQKTAGGIIIPDSAKEKPQEGKVVSTGPGKMGDDGKRVALDVKAGDRVLFSKYAGTEIKIDGVEHVFMREEDILGVME